MIYEVTKCDIPNLLTAKLYILQCGQLVESQLNHNSSHLLLLKGTVSIAELLF